MRVHAAHVECHAALQKLLTAHRMPTARDRDAESAPPCLLD